LRCITDRGKRGRAHVGTEGLLGFCSILEEKTDLFPNGKKKEGGRISGVDWRRGDKVGWFRRKKKKKWPVYHRKERRGREGKSLSSEKKRGKGQPRLIGEKERRKKLGQTLREVLQKKGPRQLKKDNSPQSSTGGGGGKDVQLTEFIQGKRRSAHHCPETSKKKKKRTASIRLMSRGKKKGGRGSLFRSTATEKPRKKATEVLDTEWRTIRGRRKREQSRSFAYRGQKKKGGKKGKKTGTLRPAVKSRSRSSGRIRRGNPLPSESEKKKRGKKRGGILTHRSPQGDAVAVEKKKAKRYRFSRRKGKKDGGKSSKPEVNVQVTVKKKADTIQGNRIASSLNNTRRTRKSAPQVFFAKPDNLFPSAGGGGKREECHPPKKTKTHQKKTPPPPKKKWNKRGKSMSEVLRRGLDEAAYRTFLGKKKRSLFSMPISLIRKKKKGGDRGKGVQRHIPG